MKRTSRPYLFLLISILFLLPVVSCAPVSSQQGWTVADLRMLDPVDNTESPSTDILAVYTRTVGFDLEIRVDLLDLPLDPDYHLQILLDTIPGGNPWDMVIDIPAGSHPTMTPADTNTIPRVIRDPWLDTVIVRINRRAVPRSFSFRVTSYNSGEPYPTDETIPTWSDALPPAQRAALALVFWDVFPAATPAQALRLLDGAHTGPRGERHGLKHILDCAGKFGIPVALLDLKTPASLAALNYLGILPQIQNLVSRNLLILPDVAYADPANVSLGYSRRVAAGFGLPASQFAYSPSDIQVDYLAQFFPLDNTTQLARSGRTRLIPLPATEETQATQDGLLLEVRRALVNALFSGDSTRLVVLGGDLPHSTWGNEDMAGPTFAWLAAHPWIQPLTAEDLITFPEISTSVLASGSTSVTPSHLVGLTNAPGNSLTASAWQTYFMFTSPTSDEKLKALRVNYIGQVGELLAAARWAEHPSIYSGCDQDLNGDDQSECVISNLQFFAILNPAGARLTNLFYLNGKVPHQLVGPSSQFTIGLSDSSEWHPELGQAADPSVIPGAFSDNSLSWTDYAPGVTPGSIEFTSQDATRIKTYTLLDNGIEITYRTSSPVSTLIPLALDPQAFYSGPTVYTGSLASTTWTWGQTNGIQVEVAADSPFSVRSFTDSLPYLSQPEDPDRAYPAGHYLPFPLSVVDIMGNGSFSVQIIIK
jgi:hypothetical protein